MKQTKDVGKYLLLADIGAILFGAAAVLSGWLFAFGHSKRGSMAGAASVGIGILVLAFFKRAKELAKNERNKDV